MKTSDPFKFSACLVAGMALLTASTSLYANKLFADWVPICSAMSSDAEKLACFMQMSKEFQAKEAKGWDAKLQGELAKAVEKQRKLDKLEAENEAKHENDRLFLRGSTDIGKMEENPAQIALTRADNQTSGLLRAAVVYMNKQALTKDGDDRYYAGLGIHRDDTKPAAIVNTSNIRLGYEKVFQFRKKDASGVDQRSWISVARVHNHTANEHGTQIDLGYRASRRWFEATELDQVKHDRLVAITLNPFIDQTRNNATGVHTRTQGVGLGLDGSWYRPTAVSWLPGGESRIVPDRLTWSTLRNTGLGGTKQFSTMNKLGLTWDFARDSGARTQSSLSLKREVGANFREGIAQSAKTLLTLDVTFN